MIIPVALVILGAWFFYREFGPVIAGYLPYANCEKNNVNSYRVAAKRMGIRILTAAPIPAPAGRSACAGLTGIWIHRDDLAKGRILMDAYFGGEVCRTGKNPYNYDV